MGQDDFQGHLYFKIAGSLFCSPENLPHAPDTDPFVEDVVAELTIHGGKLAEKS